MTLDQSIYEIKQLRLQNHSFRTKLMLSKWNDLLEELFRMPLQPDEKELIHQELDVHITQIKKDSSRKNLKQHLKLFLRYLKNNLNMQSYNYVYGLCIMAGVLIAALLDIRLLWGVILGAFIGLLAKQTLTNNRRVLIIDLYDLW